jgi:hypothetical protein
LSNGTVTGVLALPYSDYEELQMSSTRPSRSLFLALLICALVSDPLRAQSGKKAAGAAPAGLASDGKVTGTLTLNGTKFALTHIYGRKREAWPADAKILGADSVDELSCGIVELIATNGPLSEATIASILQHEYRGSEKIRGVRFVIDGAGKKWEPMFLLETGAVKGYGMTQTSGEISGGSRFLGKVTSKNEEVAQVRVIDVSFDTAIQLQYSRLETEKGERIPDARLKEEFLRMLPGQWTIERWVGLGCTTATGTLVVGERTSPGAFQGMFSITTSKGDELEEDVTISISGTKVHFEGGKVSVPPNIWGRDVLDLELWQDLLIGTNTSGTEFMVFRKSTD